MTIYKNILWIDDMDVQQAVNAADNAENMKDIEAAMRNNQSIRIERDYSPEIENLFSKSKKDSVKLITRVKEALEIMLSSDSGAENIYDYDLIVFDINMDNDKSVKKKNYEKIKEIFKDNGVLIPDDIEKFKPVGGIYLYMFLLNIGYPKERMVCFTGNTAVNADEVFRSKSIVAQIEQKGEKTGDWIENDFYLDKKNNNYYKVRRLVYQACDYWNQILSDEIKEDGDIAFNKIYFPIISNASGGIVICNEKNVEKRVTKEMFLSMLQHIKLMFPIELPNDPETLYYQVLREVTCFHESNAYGNCVNSGSSTLENSNSLKYHIMMRNFRNWSSHLKFSNGSTKLGINEFAILFIIALRTYFDNEISDFYSDLFYYEKTYFDTIEISKAEWRSLSVSYLKKLDERLKDRELVDKNNKITDLSLNSIIRKLGMQSDKVMRVEDVLYLFILNAKSNRKTGKKVTIKIDPENLKITAKYSQPYSSAEIDTDMFNFEGFDAKINVYLYSILENAVNTESTI